MDCGVIRKILANTAGVPPAPAFIEGFVVLIVPPGQNPTTTSELDVVGVYTVQGIGPAGDQPGGVSLEMLTIAPRFLNLPVVGAASVAKLQ